MKNKTIQTLLKWLAMQSTWRGIVLLCTVCGAALNPEQ